MILIVLLYALFAGSVWSSKLLLSYTQPIFLTGIRMFIAGIVLLSYQYWEPNQQFRFKRKHIWLYAQIVFFGIYASYILRFWALQGMPAPKSMFLFNLSPFFSSIYSYLFFYEKMSKKQWLGLVIGFIGLIPILLTSSKGETTELLFFSLQEIAVIISVAMHSYSWIVVRKLVREKSYSPIMVNGICMTAGGFLALVTSPFFEGLAPISNPTHFIGLLAFVIIISNFICHNLYGYLLKKYTATLISFAGFLGPLFAAAYGKLFFQESVSWHFYLSSVIVLLGLFLFYQDELAQETLSYENPT